MNRNKLIPQQSTNVVHPENNITDDTIGRYHPQTNSNYRLQRTKTNSRAAHNNYIIKQNVLTSTNEQNLTHIAKCNNNTIPYHIYYSINSGTIQQLNKIEMSTNTT